MPILGLIGGIAPASTIDYYRLIIERYRRARPDGSYPSLILNSINLTPFLALVGAGDRQAVADYLLTELDRLARAGADLALFCSNTPHLVFDLLVARSPVPLVSLVEATAAEAQARGFRRLGLLGTRYTMEGGFYERTFGPLGMAVITPEPDDRAWVHAHYLGELATGVFRVETRAGMVEVMDRMRVRDRIDAVILGGTELPLLFRGAEPEAFPLLDTTSLHVDAAVERLAGGS